VWRTLAFGIGVGATIGKPGIFRVIDVKPKFVNRLVSLLACLAATVALGQAAIAQLNTSPMNVLAKDKAAPLWVGYLQAGELAQKKGQIDLAKRYYLGSLSEVERAGSARIPGIHRVMTLEQNLASVYCVDLAKAKGDQEDKLKLREQQVAVLARINKFNQMHKASKIMTEQYQRMYDAASKALEKERAGAPVDEGDNHTFVFPNFNGAQR
jgi:hypothetical protein